MQFTKATKTKARLRMANVGPAGSGKTYTSLAIASGLGERIAVIDTEHGSASKYADLFEFDVLELTSFAPATYVQAMHAAEQAGYDVIVIDSLSHAWMGKDGALEMVDKAAKRSTSGNSFAAWRDVTPQHNAMVEAMLACRCHLIVTMRTKTEYVIEENSRGKKEPRKIGLAPVQRDGLEYEFDVVADLTIDNLLCVSKTRCPALVGESFTKAGPEVAAILKAWLTDGAPMPDKPQPQMPATSLTPEQVAELAKLASEAGLAVTDQESGEETFPTICAAMGVETGRLSDIPPAMFERCRNRLNATIRRQQEEKERAA